MIARSTSLAAKNGLLLKSRQALEQGNQLDYVFLDKTGTLTEGKFTVTGIEKLAETSKEEALKYIGALEAQTNHPLAVGVMNYLKAEGIDPYQAQEVSTLKGIGVSGTVEGHQVILANQKEIERRALSFDQEKLKEY